METGAPGPLKPKPQPSIRFMSSNSSVISNVTGSCRHAEKVDDSTTPSVIVNNSNGDGAGKDFGLRELKGSGTITVGETNSSTSAGCVREEEDSGLGLLVIEPQRKVSHSVQHHPCESAAIQQALVTRIMKAQDLEQNQNVFLYSKKVLQSLVRQREDFELKTED